MRCLLGIILRPHLDFAAPLGGDRVHRRRQTSKARTLCRTAILPVRNPTDGEKLYTTSFHLRNHRRTQAEGKSSVCISSGCPWIISADTGESTVGTLLCKYNKSLSRCYYLQQHMTVHTVASRTIGTPNHLLFFLPTTLRTPPTC